jgi:hypothetical protein
MRLAGFPVIVTAVLALGACAEVRWQKTGGDDSALAQDLMTCRKLAQEKTARMWGSAPRVDLNPVFGPTGPSQADLRMQEGQAVTVCMREKGYALVPVSAADK